MEDNTVSITLWGDGLVKGKWIEWYNSIGLIFQSLGYKRTHIGMQSQSYSNSKIVTAARKEAHILQLLQNEEPQTLSCYALPKEFRTAAFDYEELAVREAGYISLIVKENDLKRMDVDAVIEQLIQYIEFEDGELYRMDRSEMPLLYAAKANSVEWYKTLEVLRKF